MTETEIIRALLETYLDASNGIFMGWDGAGDDPTGEMLMCAAWNHPSFRELERLRVVLKGEKPRVYWHVAERYFRAQERRVMRCTHGSETDHWCSFWLPIATYQRAKSMPVHRHAAGNFKLVPTLVRLVPLSVDQEVVDAAVDWFRESWRDSVPIVFPGSLVGRKPVAVSG